jgi:hypothetical protein
VCTDFAVPPVHPFSMDSSPASAQRGNRVLWMLQCGLTILACIGDTK